MYVRRRRQSRAVLRQECVINNQEGHPLYYW